MGTVYRVVDAMNGKECALKILHALADDDHAAARFRREIEILSRLRHPSIVDIIDFGIDDTRMYFTTELLDGDDLRTILKERTVFSPDETVRIAAAIAEALATAHERGIVHRDIKPHNVMITANGQVKLLDFGIARGAGIEMNTITATGVMVGTPEYMSPEQFQGLRVDARSDLYSLGIVMYEMLAGSIPFRADTPVGLGIAHQTEVPRPIRAQRPNVPAWLERAIFKCLEKDPSQRFLSARDLLEELNTPRTGEKRTLTLPNGDQIVEDDSGTEPWALTLVTPHQRLNWSNDMALIFETRYYRLEEIREAGDRWIYNFTHWPEGQIFRKVIDYGTDSAVRQRPPGLAGKLKGWLDRK